MTALMRKALESGLAVWAALLATLILIVVILALIGGMTTVVLTIAIVGAVILGISGLFVLRRLFN